MTETYLRFFRAILAAVPYASTAETEETCINRGMLMFQLFIPERKVVVVRRMDKKFHVRVNGGTADDLHEEEGVVGRVLELLGIRTTMVDASKKLTPLEQQVYAAAFGTAIALKGMEHERMEHARMIAFEAVINLRVGVKTAHYDKAHRDAIHPADHMLLSLEGEVLAD